MIRFVRKKVRGTARISGGGPVGVAAAKAAAPTAKVGPLFEAEFYEALQDAIAHEQPEGPQIAVLVPVLSRPHRVQPLLDSFHDATSPDDAQIYFVAQRSDHGELAAIQAAGVEPILVDDVDRSWANKINRGYAHTTEPWILLGADDLSFRRGWVDTIRDLLRSYGGMIGTNDLGNASTMRGTASTHPLVRRQYAKIFGTADERDRVVHEGYDHNFPDAELGLTAQHRGLYIHRRNCVIEHMHPLWGKAASDPIYQLGLRRWYQDQALFKSRCKKFGFT